MTVLLQIKLLLEQGFGSKADRRNLGGEFPLDAAPAVEKKLQTPLLLVDLEGGLRRGILALELLNLALDPLNLAPERDQVVLFRLAPGFDLALQLPVHRVELPRRNPVLADKPVLRLGLFLALHITRPEEHSLQAREQRGALLHHWEQGLAPDQRLEG